MVCARLTDFFFIFFFYLVTSNDLSVSPQTTSNRVLPLDETNLHRPSKYGKLYIVLKASHTRAPSWLQQGAATWRSGGSLIAGFFCLRQGILVTFPSTPTGKESSDFSYAGQRSYTGLVLLTTAIHRHLWPKAQVGSSPYMKDWVDLTKSQLIKISPKSVANSNVLTGWLQMHTCTMDWTQAPRTWLNVAPLCSST